MLRFAAANIRHHRGLFLGAFTTLLIGAAMIGVCAQLLATAVMAPDEGFEVQVSGSGVLDNDGAPTVATEFYTPLGSGAEDLMSVAGTVGIIACFLTGITLATTVGYVIAARRRELGILRLLGTTAPILRRLLIWEIVTLATVAGIAGVVLSIPIAPLVLGLLIDTGFVSEKFDVTGQALSLAATVVATIGVAIVGARIGSKRVLGVSPLAATRSITVTHRIPARRWALSGAALALVLVIGALGAGAPGDGAVGLGLLLPMILCGALAAVAPVAIPAIVGLLARSLDLIRGRRDGTVHLATRTARSARAATTVLAVPALLFVGIAGSVLVTIGADNTAVDLATREEVRADFVVTNPPADINWASVPDAVVDASLSTELVTTDRDTAIGLDAAGIEPVPFSSTRSVRVLDGRLEDMTGGPVPGVALSAQAASDDDYAVGQELRFATGDGVLHNLPIVAIVQGSPTLVPSILVPREWLAANAPDAVAGPAFVAAAEGVDADEILSSVRAAVPGEQVLGVAEWLSTSSSEYASGDLAGVIVVLLPAGLFCFLATVNATLMWSTTRSGTRRGLTRLGVSARAGLRIELLSAVLLMSGGLVTGLAVTAVTGVMVRTALLGSPLAEPSSLSILSLAFVVGIPVAAVAAPVLVTRLRKPGTGRRAEDPVVRSRQRHAASDLQN
ncbi:FtsX-like permease family protein [Rhodococcus sp. ABRD24]|uniref:FtsX-like permease family protein n=1 Tax=Rhodococcus sp. ABRD24 TaxID=2507582 RepID=UPI00325B6917